MSHSRQGQPTGAFPQQERGAIMSKTHLAYGIALAAVVGGCMTQ